jgi:hypothetical protein
MWRPKRRSRATSHRSARSPVVVLGQDPPQLDSDLNQPITIPLTIRRIDLVVHSEVSIARVHVSSEGTPDTPRIIPSDAVRKVGNDSIDLQFTDMPDR